MRTRAPRRGLAGVFAIPLALFIASIAGLVAGLTGDGWADAIAWALLSIPVLAAAVAFARRG